MAATVKRSKYLNPVIFKKYNSKEIFWSYEVDSTLVWLAFLLNNKSFLFSILKLYSVHMFTWIWATKSGSKSQMTELLYFKCVRGIVFPMKYLIHKSGTDFLTIFTEITFILVWIEFKLIYPCHVGILTGRKGKAEPGMCSSYSCNKKITIKE